MTVTDLKLAFITALLTALATVLIQAMFGKKVAWVVGFVGSVCVFLPLGLIIFFGVAGMLDLGPGGAGKAASTTIGGIIDYMVDNLPDLVISAIAGAVVGFLVGLLKKATPKKVRRRIGHKMRLRA